MKGLQLLVVMLATLVCFIPCAPNYVKAITENGPLEADEVDIPPRTIKVFPPRYPWKAKIDNIEGRVLMRFVITADGTVRDIEVVASTPEGVFDEAAVKALEKYQFKPATKNGKPVDCIVRLPIAFTLDTWNLSDYYNNILKEAQNLIEAGQYELAVRSLTTAIKVYQKHSLTYFFRGLSYRATGEYKKALSDFKRAIKLDSKEPVYYDERGVIYSLLEDYPKAIKDFDKAIALNPDFNEAYFNRGNALKETGNYSDAIEDYTEVISIDEGNLPAYINRGYCYNKLGDTGNTCTDFKRACELGDCRAYEALKKGSRCPGDVSELLETIKK